MPAHAIELLARPLEAKIAFFCQTKGGSIMHIIDTCTLLNNKFIGVAMEDAQADGGTLIVPQKVREELYGLLKGKRNRYAVIHAQQLISRNKWGVLPHHGMFRDGDEEILSYCSMHADAPLRVYTRDKGLAKRIAARCPRVQVVQ